MNGSISAILANITPDVAATIPIQKVIVDNGGQLHGTSGDDELFPTANANGVTIYFDANSGNDYITHFNMTLDTLVFPQNTSIVWHDTLVNGEAALLGTFAGGSVTIGGLNLSEVSQLHLLGVASSTTGAEIASAWSVPSDSLV